MCSSRRKILYIDMDIVIADFRSAVAELDQDVIDKYGDKVDEIDGIFSNLKPMPGALDAIHFLAKHFDLYILSTAPWNNPSAWKDKLLWVKKYLPEIGYKRLIITHHKNLNKGDYLIDDRLKHGVAEFEGERIYFGQEGFEDWEEINNCF